MGLFFIYGIFSNQRLLPQFCINYIVCYLLLLNLNKQHRLAENGLTVILFIFFPVPLLDKAIQNNLFV